MTQKVLEHSSCLRMVDREELVVLFGILAQRFLSREHSHFLVSLPRLYQIHDVHMGFNDFLVAMSNFDSKDL